MHRTLAALAATSILLLPACGGDDGADSPADTGGDRLSKAEFLSQGDAICSGLEADGEALGVPASEEEFGPFIREAVTLAQGAREEFAALNPPEDGEQVQQALLDALDTSIETAEGAATAAEGGDTVTAGDLLTQASEEGDAADAEAQEYGFEECGTSADDAASEEGEPAAGPELTKEEYVTQADAVCTQFVDGTETVTQPADETDLARYLLEISLYAGEARASLEELTPPADGQQVHEDLKSSFDIYVEGVTGAAEAAEQGDTVTAGDLLEQATQDSNAADASAQAYGLQVCGSDAG